MTKRLGMFLGVGFVGVLLLLTGLAWDAVLHAQDPALAGREGLFTLSNPGHLFLGLGMGLVVVSLVGGCETLLSASTSPWWGRPGVRRAFLSTSTAVVVLAAAVSSWAGGAGHDHGAAGHGGELAAAQAAHGHPGDGSPGRAAADGDDHDGHEAPGGPGSGHDGAGDPAGDGHPGSGSSAGAHDADDAGFPGGAHDAQGSAALAGAHDDHDDHGSGSSATAHDAHGQTPRGAGGSAAGTAPGSTGHDHPPGDPASGPSGGSGPATGGNPEPVGHDHPGHEGAGPAPAGSRATPADVPAGTWSELRYGPFAITPGAAGGSADHANIALPSLAKPCTNCFLLEVRPDLVYADGTSANLDTGMMLHHAVLFDASRPDVTCGPNEPFPGKLGLRFFASGNERTVADLPAGFGYYVAGGNWSGIFHVMNHGAEPRTVYLALKVRWSPAAAGGIRPVTPIWLDMNNCRTSEYAVPAGPSSSHWTWTSTLTGRVLSTAGHVHNGGIRTTLSNQTTGEHLCTSWAGWGRKPAYQGSVESMSVCSWDRVGTVRAGEVLDLESVYDAPQSVPDAMGIMMAFVYETNDLGAGTPAPPGVRGEGRPPVESTPPPSSHDHH